VNKNLLKYGISIAVGAAITVAIMFSYGITGAETAAEVLKILADAFTFSGLLLILAAALVFVSNEGALDGIGYAGRHAIQMMIPVMNKSMETFAEYKERKREKGRVKGYSFILFTGLGYFTLAIIFIALFYIFR